MTKRLIRSHKGGRTARAPEARMTPNERAKLETVLEMRGVKHTDWYIAHVNADYAEITGDTMAKLDAFNGAYFEVWYKRGERGAHCISKSVYAKDEQDAIKKATAAAPARLDMSKVTAQKV